MAGFVGELWGWRAAALAVSVLAAVAAVLFLVLVPQARGFTAAAAGGFRGAFRTLAGHSRNPRLLALYVQAFLLMGGFVAVYNYLGFRLSGEPFSLPATIISLIFLAYLSGTVSSRWAGGLAARFGRRTVLIAGTVLMVAGLALTLTALLPLIMAGLLLFTGGFFAAHSIGAGWTGAIATTGRAQAASLYNLAYYLGSSVIGWAGGLVFQSLGWTALALTVIGLACTTAVITAVVHPARPAPAAGAPAGRQRVASMACTRSATMSDGSSRPTDTRSRPACGLASAATGRWVSPAGCWIRVSMPPSETACVIMPTADGIRSACSALPTSKASSEPGPDICVPISPCGSHSGSPG